MTARAAILLMFLSKLGIFKLHKITITSTFKGAPEGYIWLPLPVADLCLYYLEIPTAPYRLRR